MDFYVISPVSNLEPMRLGDRIFVLAHLWVQYKDYREFIYQLIDEEPDRWITLDNSAAERALVTEDILIEICKELIPSEVIAPDVLFDKDVIMNMVKSFSNDIDCVYGNVILVNEVNKIVRKYSSSNFRLKDFELGHMPPHPSFYVRMNAFQKYGSYNTSFKISSDYDLLLRFLYLHKLKAKYLDFIIVKMRDGGISSSLKNKWLLNKEVLLSCRLHNVNTNFLKVYSKYIFKWRAFFPNYF